MQEIPAEEDLVVQGEDSDDSIVIYDNIEGKKNAEIHENEVNRLARPFFVGTFFVKYPYISLIVCSTILIICAGPSGMEAAVSLGKRGYTVALAEADNEIGGRALKESLLAIGLEMDWKGN